MRNLVIALSFLLLSACGDAPPPPPLESLQLAGSSYTLNVASISVVQDYRSPKRPPNVEYLSDITPAQAVKQWADAKLAASGHDNTLEVDIKDASIIRTDLPKQKTGIEGMFTSEQTEQYDGSLEVEIKIYSPQSPLPVAHLDVKTNRTLTLSEDADTIDRKHLYHNMSVDLMQALEPELDSNIRRYLAHYL